MISTRVSKETFEILKNQANTLSFKSLRNFLPITKIFAIKLSGTGIYYVIFPSLESDSSKIKKRNSHVRISIIYLKKKRESTNVNVIFQFFYNQKLRIIIFILFFFVFY